MSRARISNNKRCFNVKSSTYYINTNMKILADFHIFNICFIDNKHISPRFHCNRSGLHLNYYGTKKLQENFLYELAKLD